MIQRPELLQKSVKLDLEQPARYLEVQFNTLLQLQVCLVEYNEAIIIRQLYIAGQCIPKYKNAP
jgi:hypothetical protein